MIGIIDYGMGNLKSVRNALEYIGYDTELITDPDNIREVTHLILPGVGSYALAMANLKSRNFENAIKKYISEHKPFMGVCLGMQLLSTIGYEHGKTEGLNIIEGEVILLERDEQHEIPHVGWNNVNLQYSHPVFEGVKKNLDFYFVHSYHFKPVHKSDILGITDYGTDFVSCIARNNVIGVQFHPEKSQESGLKIYENFCEWNGQC
jgi:glutamine amidotransferase